MTRASRSRLLAATIGRTRPAALRGGALAALRRRAPGALVVRAAHAATALLACGLALAPACGTTTDLCTQNPPNADCGQCRTLPRAKECPQCQGATPDPDCENARDADASGGGPLPLVDGSVPGSGGASGASGTDGGNDAGDDGGAGTGADACPQGCTGTTPVCLRATDTCVECRTHADCDGSKSVCDPDTHECVECLEHADCGGSAPRCDEAAHACVECLVHADCDDATAAKCATGTHTCVACTASSQCAHVAGKSVCDLADGECVECAGTDYASCGEDSGTPLVCDSLARTCTNKKERSTGLCGTCVSDAQCNLGQLCVMQEFGAPATDVGYFCFWQKNAGVGGAPNDCTTARPFVDAQPLSDSIDGTTATICGLALTTCQGYSDFRNVSVNCEPSPNTSDDSLCGVAGLDDAYCRYFSDDGMGNNTYRCTMPCLSDDDCKIGSTCNTGASPNVCNL